LGEASGARSGIGRGCCRLVFAESVNMRLDEEGLDKDRQDRREVS
jgi:hypothetical protein